MWWIIVVIIAISVIISIILFLRWGLSLSKKQKEFERIVGKDWWSKGTQGRTFKNDDEMAKVNKALSDISGSANC